MHFHHFPIVLASFAPLCSSSFAPPAMLSAPPASSAAQSTPHANQARASRQPYVPPGYVYWTVALPPTSIGRAELNGLHPDPNFISTQTVDAVGLSIDARSIYWTIQGNGQTPGSIGRVNRDGSNANPDFIALPLTSMPLSVAVDAAHVYWTDGQLQAIGRADLNGSNAQPWFLSTGDMSLPMSVAVDGQFIYWSSPATFGSPLPASIGRANLDGSNADRYFILTTGGALNGIAVDEQHIYWTEYSAAPPFSSSIARAAIDGSSQESGFIPDIATHVISLALHGPFIYWTTPSLGWIGRARLDGSNSVPNFIKNTLCQGYGLAVGGN